PSAGSTPSLRHSTTPPLPPHPPATVTGTVATVVPFVASSVPSAPSPVSVATRMNDELPVSGAGRAGGRTNLTLAAFDPLGLSDTLTVGDANGTDWPGVIVPSAVAYRSTRADPLAGTLPALVRG